MNTKQFIPVLPHAPNRSITHDSGGEVGLFHDFNQTGVNDIMVRDDQKHHYNPV